LGVSSDSIESHARFAKKLNLQFPLLSDSGGHLRRLWGVPKKFQILPGRVTYVIDGNGILRLLCKSLRVNKHAEEALRMVQHLSRVN
jgi:thioredoxin-dependent peroxiredoxin